MGQLFKISLTGLWLIVLTLTTVSSQVFFEEYTIQQSFNGACSISGADFDNDNDFDLVVTSSAGSKIGWFENDGNQNFTEHLVINGFSGARVIYAADIDSDSDADFAAVAYGAGKVSWFENDGSGVFTEHIVTDTLNGASFIFVSDLDLDTDMDLIVTACGSNTLIWYENIGNQIFVAHPLKENWYKCNGAFPVDLDLDGDIDIIATAKAGQILWFKNDGSQNFIEDTIESNWGAPSSVQAADIDNDGDIDIAATSCTGGQGVAWYENNGMQEFQQHIIRNDYVGARSVTISDIDSDNDLDILASAWTGSIASVFENDGNCNFTERIFCHTAYDLLKIFTVDLDKDNNMDIVGSTYFGGHEIRWWKNIPTFLVPEFSLDYTSGHSPLTVSFQDLSYCNPSAYQWKWDFDNDGEIDSYEQNPDWTFDTQGSYDVKLIVNSDSLSDTIIKTDVLRVFNGESALEFYDNNSQVYIEADTSLNITNNFTIEAWINPRSFADNQGVIIDKGCVKIFIYSSGYLANQDSCLVVCFEHDGNVMSNFSTMSNTISLNEWQHIALTYDADQQFANIYINGIEQSIDYIENPSGAIADNSEIPIRIGNNIYSTYAFDGIIDEIRLWKSKRTGDEISTNMLKHISPENPQLINCWEMNEGFGDTIYGLANEQISGTLNEVKWQQGVDLEPLGTPVVSTTERSPLQLMIYPNPVKDKLSLQIYSEYDAGTSIRVFDIHGKIIFSFGEDFLLKKGLHHLHLDLNKYLPLLDDGVYLLQLKTDHSFKYAKFIIQKD